MSIPVSRPTCAVCVIFRVKPEFAEQFHTAVQQQARNSLEREPWCHQFDVSTSTEDPNTFLLYETYDSREAFELKHRTTEHFSSFGQQISDWVESKQFGIWDID